MAQISYMFLMLGVWILSGQAMEFTPRKGDCFYKKTGASFEVMKKNQSFLLEPSSILKAPYGIEGDFVFSEGSAKINSELIFKVNSDGLPVMIQGTLSLKIKDTFVIHTPSGKFSLEKGHYQLSIMEGFGVLDCLSGQGQITTSQEILDFRSRQKIVFSHKGQLKVKENS